MKQRLHSKTYKGIAGMIPGGISIKDYSMVTHIDHGDAYDILESLILADIGQKDESGDTYLFDQGDKLKAAIHLLEQGVQPDQVSPALHWRDFEGLTAEVLASKGCATIKNLTFTKPRMEIDVIGIRLGIAILVDCKHWKRYSRSVLDTVVTKQIKRTKRYVEDTPGAIGLPVIVTLYGTETDFVQNVPVVPIQRLGSFADDIYGNIDSVKTIETTDQL